MNKMNSLKDSPFLIANAIGEQELYLSVAYEAESDEKLLLLHESI